jgi:hypothetical protein
MRGGKEFITKSTKSTKSTKNIKNTKNIKKNEPQMSRG